MQHRTFTHAEEREAERLSATAQRLVDEPSRPIVRGTAIDKRETKDRDDAFDITFTNDAVIITVTIADVAAVVPQGSALDVAAQERGFTLYRSYGRSPMVPFGISEGSASLTDEALRPGFTYTMMLDRETGELRHFTFGPSRIQAEVRTYDAVSSDAAYADWLKVGEWLSGIRQQKGFLPLYDAEAGQAMTDEGEPERVRKSQMGAYRLVQEAMVLTNQAAAEWAAQAGLPFIYRNHYATLRIVPDSYAYYTQDAAAQALAKLGIPATDLMTQVSIQRARYEAENHGHFGTGAEGYSHMTSPIRRYVDLVNSRMMHYAHQQIEAITNWAAGYYAPDQRPAVEAHVWQHSASLMRHVEEARAGGRDGHKARKKLAETLSAMVPQLNGTGLKAADLLVTALLERALPYTHRDMEGIAAHINILMDADRKDRKQDQDQEVMRWLSKVFPDTDDRITEFSLDSFSRLLRGAAENGHMSPRFYEEVAGRMAASELMVPEDYATLVACVDHHADPRWRELQERALAHLGKVPAHAIQVYRRVQEILGMQGQLLEASIRGSDGSVLSAAAVMAKNNDGDRFSSPYFALARAPETARHMAYVQFMEQVARGELLDVECVQFPPALAIKLPQRAEQAGALWQELLDATGIQVQEESKPRGGRQTVKLILSGGPLKGAPIIIRGSGATVERARQAAEVEAMSDGRLKPYMARLNGSKVLREPLDIHDLNGGGIAKFSSGEGGTPEGAIIPKRWVEEVLRANPPCNGYHKV